MSSACKIVTCDTTPNRGFTGPTGPAGGSGPTALLQFAGTIGAVDGTYVFANDYAAIDLDADGVVDYPVGESGLTARTLSVQLQSAVDAGTTYTALPRVNGSFVSLTTPITFTNADVVGTVKSSTISTPQALAAGDSVGMQIALSGGDEGTSPVLFTGGITLGQT